MRLEPGNQLDRYTIEAIIGEGGMGRVCRAFDTRLHRRVALKVLHLSDGVDSADAVSTALREARAAAALAHPNATAVYDADELEGVPYIVMEFVPGTSLRQIISGPPAPLPLRIRWLVDIASALGAAHHVGIIHRDVKPENVMVRDDGLVKVLDFGVARRTISGTLTHDSISTDHASTPDGGGRLVGTPAYMPPEQIRGEAIDGRADQFAWGVVAYELLTGRLPWKTAREFLGYIAAVLTEKPEPPRSIAADIPPVVEAAIIRALAKNPVNRFPSMSAVAAELLPFALDSRHGATGERSTPSPSPQPAISSPSGQGSTPASPPASLPASLPASPPASRGSSPGHTPTHERRPPSYDIPLRPLPSPPPSRPAQPPPPPRSASDIGMTVRSGPFSSDAPSARARSHSPLPVIEPVTHQSGSTSSVPPARGSAPTPSASGLGGRRSLADAHHKLREPRFDGSADLDAHLALLPGEATCKGLFFVDLLRMGARVATPAELSRNAQIAERRYVGFRDYSAAENLRLTVAVAKAVYPRLSLGEALRRIGQATFDNVLGTQVGRSTLGILGPDIERILLAAPRTLKHLVNFGRVTSEKAGAHTYVFRVKELPVFLETYLVGVLEGALRHCRATGRVRIAIDDLATGMAEIRVD